MTIAEQIEKDFIGAVKAREAFVVSVLRMLRASLKNAEIEKRDKLDEAEVISVLGKEVKQIKDSLESFKQGGRDDLVSKSEKELEVLSKYLPEQLGEDELKTIVKNKISELGATGPADFGRVMAEVIKETKGKADGGAVSAVVKVELSHTTS